MTFTRRFVLKTAIAAPLAGITAQAAWAATAHDVAIKNFEFDAADITIKVGDTIRFTNLDRAPHTATADDRSFNSGTLKKGEASEITFAAAGEFSYFCKFHRKMKAVVRVTA